MTELPALSSLSTRGRYLLLAQDEDLGGCEARLDAAARPRIRRYQLSRIAGAGRVDMSPGPRPAGDFSHLRLAFD